MPDVSLCIINYNGAEHLPGTLAALDAQEWPFAEVLLVDNASTDRSLAVAEAHCPRARVIRLERNLGPGAARNAGFAAARSELILFLDNDVRLQPDTVGLLVAELQENPGTLVVAPRVLYGADAGRIQFDSADCHFLGLMATRNADTLLGDADDRPGETSSVVTACFLMDRRLWQYGDPFDDTLGFNLEDHDFGVRAGLAGHRLRVQPQARVLHGTGTAGLSYRPGQKPSLDRQFYLTRNRWIVVAKSFSGRTLLVLAPAFLVFEAAQLAWLVGQGRGAIWLRALRSFWDSRGRVRAIRRTLQRSRVTPDGRILRDAPLPLTRHARSGGAARLAGPALDRMLRAYWRLVRGWI